MEQMTDARALREAIDRYWELAYAEGKDGRTHDTENGDAQKTSMEIDRLIARLRGEAAQESAPHAHLRGAHIRGAEPGCLLCEAIQERDDLRAQLKAAQGEQQAVVIVQPKTRVALIEGLQHERNFRVRCYWDLPEGTELFDRPQPVAVAGDAVLALDRLEGFAGRRRWAYARMDDFDIVRAALSAAPAAPAYPGDFEREVEFQRAVAEARRVWMDENPCEEGTDHVTPFDTFLYQRAPVAGDAVHPLIEDWRGRKPRHSDTEAVYKRCAAELETALAQDRASQAGAAGVPGADECSCENAGCRYDARGCTCSACGKRPKWYLGGRRIRVTEYYRAWKHTGSPKPFEAEVTWHMNGDIEYRIDGDDMPRRLNDFRTQWETVEVLAAAPQPAAEGADRASASGR